MEDPKRLYGMWKCPALHVEVYLHPPGGPSWNQFPLMKPALLLHESRWGFGRKYDAFSINWVYRVPENFWMVRKLITVQHFEFQEPLRSKLKALRLINCRCSCALQKVLFMVFDQPRLRLKHCRLMLLWWKIFFPAKFPHTQSRVHSELYVCSLL